MDRSTLETMEKHAYLIMAYNNWHQLATLLSLLDDSRNDIYIHIDAKAGEYPQQSLIDAVHESSIYFIPRKKVYWADYSQADVEMDLMQNAINTGGHYRYYHLMSGMCLPLKTQNEIHAFFANETREFIAMRIDGGTYVEKHARYYHPFLHNSVYRRCKPLKALDRGVMYVQRILGLKRKFGLDLTISTGWQWFSITDDFCRYVLSQRAFIQKMFSYVLDVDEKFMGTMVNKLGCHDRIYHISPQDGTNVDYMIGSLRLVDFDKPVPQPYTWGRDKDSTQKDFETLINSGYMFARKFDERVNNDIIQKIVQYLTEKKNGEIADE